MDSTPTLEDIVRFYDEVGAPSSFGCDEGEVKNWISYCEEKYPEKGICTVKAWAVVECRCNESEVLALKHKLGVKPFVLKTNYVLWDSKNRWPSGSIACSYFLIEIEESCLFITKNTCYIMVGQGRQKSITPSILLAVMNVKYES
jgi:hypothetical protein